MPHDSKPSPLQAELSQQALVDVLLKEPAIESVVSYIGPGGPTATLNQGRVFIMLKPREQRDASADQVIDRLRTPLARIQGISLYMQATQDISIGARLAKTQYQYTTEWDGIKKIAKNFYSPVSKNVFKKLNYLFFKIA